MSLKILLIGANGQVASSLQAALVDEEVVPLSHQQLDIRDARAVTEMVRSARPDVVINPAAMRRPDECEAAPEKAFAVNAIGPRNLALACHTAGCALVQISTDNVFDGTATTPYPEDARPNPVNVYGVTKLAAEQFVKAILDRYYIIRTSALFGGTLDRSRRSNFVLTLLGRDSEGLDTQVVTDQRVAPTYTQDLAAKVAWLIRREAYGITHVTNAGDCTWFEFATALAGKAGLRRRLIPISTETLASPAHRLRYAVLGRGTLQRLQGDDLPSWDDALDRYLRALGVSIAATAA